MNSNKTAVQVAQATIRNVMRTLRRSYHEDPTSVAELNALEEHIAGFNPPAPFSTPAAVDNADDFSDMDLAAAPAPGSKFGMTQSHSE